jgi:pimeloyl-ACP methyl ester carboxylesterase
MMTTRLVRFEADNGNTLVGRLVYPQGTYKVPMVVLCHGWRSNMNSGRNKLLAQQLAEEGIGSLAIDFRGHGKSGGNIRFSTVTSEANDIVSALVFLQGRRRYNGRFAIVGASIGTSAVLYFLGSYGYEWHRPDWSNLCCAVLISPRSDFHGVPEDMYCFNQNGVRVENRKMLPDGRSIDFYALATHNDDPVLVIHGEKDEFIPLAQSQKLVASKPGTYELRVIQGGNHTLHDDRFRKQVVEQSLKFLIKHLK